MPSTQSHLPIEDIKDNLVFLKNGSVSTVIETTAVNFGLLFETEQVAIIDAFAGLLNSLSFPIQIIIRSQRLDVSSYLNTLDKALASQNNLLLKGLTQNYRHFVDSLIKENEVLDKRFYICLSAHSFELGVLKLSTGDRSQKAMTLLKPRVDHLNRQLNRIGLKSKIVTTTDLVKLFYDIYNGDGYQNLPAKESPIAAPTPRPPVPVAPKAPVAPQTTTPQPPKLQRLPHQNTAAAMGTPVLYQQPVNSPRSTVYSQNQAVVSSQPAVVTPQSGPHFVVEELPE